MKKSGILLFILTGCLIQTLGQETLRFHADPNLFIQEAREFFGNTQPEVSRAVLLKLEDAQKNGKLEENHWIDLARKSNTIEKQGARPFPDFYNLLDAFLEISIRTTSRPIYLAWSGYIDKLLDDNKKSPLRSKLFLEFIVNLSKKGILYKSSAFTWSVKPGLSACGVDSAFYVTIDPSNLVASGSGDSTVIFSTQGRYYPEQNLFCGEGGRITWERLKLPASQVYVKLNRYRINLTKSAYVIDSVNLIDQRYFTEPLIGQVENKILPGAVPSTAGYPRFTSYEMRNRIKNIYPGMDYEGGFSLQGLKVTGTGLPTQKCVLTVFRNQKPLLRLASTYFSFQPDQARGINTESSIYLETDSIYHPGLLFQYTDKQKELSLIRDGQGLSPSRFLNSYHDYDLDVKWVRWRLGDSLMTMTGLPGSVENRASFESADFFSIDRYNEILVADKKHPVAFVKQCADHYHSRKFTLSELALFMEKPQHLVEEMLLRLSFLGFVRYNSETKLVEVQERAYDFLNKNAGLQDYDVIRFESVHPPPAANAILNLSDNHLKVFSVKSVEISQSRKVSIYPAQSTIEILKDRNILFDGEIRGGLVRISGKKFRFMYDDFYIRLDDPGQLRMQVYEKQVRKNQVPKLADVTSVIEYIRGVLTIDEPSNKSGLKSPDYPEYPILQTDTNSYVYYDQKEILNGIYPRNTFNFTISPFTLKGLNLYSFRDSLVFPGLFKTADIFPPLELALRHQADHSLGFETLSTPEEGYPVYKGKGRFYNTIALSKAGLKGSGKLEYLNSTLFSEDFLFLPEQVNIATELFSVRKDTAGFGNPETQGQQVLAKWYPAKDQLVAQGTKGLLNMYGDGKFDGVLSIDQTVMSGKGSLSFDGYTLTSNEIKFNEDSFEARDGVLKIFADSLAVQADSSLAGSAGTYLIANHYNSLVDLKNKKGRFEPAGDGSHVVFTKNRFEGQPVSFNWDITRGQLSLDEVEFRMASKPSDSLNFKSGQADFYIKNQYLDAHSVEFVDVADVRIFPVDQNLVIRNSARIDTLMNATIVSRDTTLVHRITNAAVSIVTDKKYVASGFYQYRDVAGRDFAIRFSDIQPDKRGISIGTGLIGADNKFSLSPAFKYYGSVEWNNDERFLLFDGQTQLSHSCLDISLHWIRFSSRISPDSVVIPIDSVTRNDQNERLFKGFFLSNQPVELYSTFVGPHTRYSDRPLISAYGCLWYDESRSLYKLSSAEKITDPEADGPILEFNADGCLTEARGPLTFGVDLGQVKINAAGKFLHDLRKDSVRGSVMLTLDFFFDPKNLDFMAKSINNSPGLESVNYADPDFRQAFKAFLGRTNGEELLKQISLYGKWRKIPDELLHTMVFTDVRFKWNPETGSYQSTGKIGIGNIMSEPINKKVNGFMEIMHRRGGDALTIYLEINRQNYFFLTYSRGVMQCVAGHGFEKFNTMIRDSKESARILKTEPGETGYQYYIGTYGQVSEFLRRFRVDR